MLSPLEFVSQMERDETKVSWSVNQSKSCGQRRNGSQNSPVGGFMGKKLRKPNRCAVFSNPDFLAFFQNGESKRRPPPRWCSRRTCWKGWGGSSKFKDPTATAAATPDQSWPLNRGMPGYNAFTRSISNWSRCPPPCRCFRTLVVRQIWWPHRLSVPPRSNRQRAHHPSSILWCPWLVTPSP